MKKIIEKIKAFILNAWKWFNGLDDKMKHTIVCFIGSLCFGYGFGLGAGFAAEYKDKAWGGSWDWWDIVADMVGTIIGGMAHYLLFSSN
jgi:hypothetical protein